jgi:hypothetical protein
MFSNNPRTKMTAKRATTFDRQHNARQFSRKILMVLSIRSPCRGAAVAASARQCERGEAFSTNQLWNKREPAQNGSEQNAMTGVQRISYVLDAGTKIAEKVHEHQLAQKNSACYSFCKNSWRLKTHLSSRRC